MPYLDASARQGQQLNGVARLVYHHHVSHSWPLHLFILASRILNATAKPRWQRLQPACLRIGRRRSVSCKTAVLAFRRIALRSIQARRGFILAWSESFPSVVANARCLSRLSSESEIQKLVLQVRQRPGRLTWLLAPFQNSYLGMACSRDEATVERRLECLRRVLRA